MTANGIILGSLRRLEGHKMQQTPLAGIITA